jgi:transcriptional regulator GlxA family with amidase domain
MQIAILLYENMTALDVVGPYQVLVNLPGAEVKLVAKQVGPVRSDTGMCIVADSKLADVPNPDIIVIPGGMDSSDAMDDATQNWIKTVHETTDWTTSVCTGALVLGTAGLLKGLPAATHWAALGELADPDRGAIPVSDRWVEVPESKIFTSAGVSAGIDMALKLAERVAGREVAQTIQLCIQYDPRPPFDTGSPATATEQMIADARKIFAERIDSLPKLPPCLPE